MMDSKFQERRNQGFFRFKQPLYNDFWLNVQAEFGLRQ